MSDFWWGVIFGASVTALILAFTADPRVAFNYRDGAIERGYALYCPTDGKWAWKGECDQ